MSPPPPVSHVTLLFEAEASPVWRRRDAQMHTSGRCGAVMLGTVRAPGEGQPDPCAPGRQPAASFQRSTLRPKCVAVCYDRQNAAVWPASLLTW